MNQQFTAQFLEERCTELRALFLEDGTATAQDLDPYWPGGDENRLDGQDAWIMAYGRCLWVLGRQIGKEQAERSSSRMTPKQADVLRALRADPERVELLADGETRREMTVYPKSALALEHISAANLLLAFLTDAEEDLTAQLDAETVSLLIDVRAKRGYLERLACWIATHPGPGLPYPEHEREPALPDAINALTPFDYYLLAAAFQRVNGERLQGLEATGQKGKRADWGGFFVGAASELGVAARTLLRDMSLVEVVATVSEKGRLHAEAREQAEAERKGGGTVIVEA